DAQQLPVHARDPGAVGLRALRRVPLARLARLLGGDPNRHRAPQAGRPVAAGARHPRTVPSDRTGRQRGRRDGAPGDDQQRPVDRLRALGSGPQPGAQARGGARRERGPRSGRIAVPRPWLAATGGRAGGLSAERRARGPALRVDLLIDNLGSGGAQRQLVELACALTCRGVEARIVAYRAVSSGDVDLYGQRSAAAGLPVSLVAERRELDPTHPSRLARALAGADLVQSYMPIPSLWVCAALSRMTRAERPRWIACERTDPAS